jgi:hypothetical protein
MGHTTLRRVAALGGCTVLALTLHVSARAADATHTAITSPSGRTTLELVGNKAITVSGTASAGVTAVDIVCDRGNGDQRFTNTFTSGVPVSSGSFSTSVTVPGNNVDVMCRLRALPQGTDPFAADLSAFSGPILNLDTLAQVTDGTTPVDMSVYAGSGDGQMSMTSAGRCGLQQLYPVGPDLADATFPEACMAALNGGSTGGPALRIDGHTALLPFQTFSFGAEESSLRATMKAKKNGRMAWTESSQVVRCAGTDAFPPLFGQCNSTVPTGVNFVRSGTFDSSGLQVALRDRFVSADGKKHTVVAAYDMQWPAPDTGALGFDFPGKRGGFRGSQTGQVVKGLPTRAASFLVRSDRFSTEGDPAAFTQAVTWSRTPDRLAFSDSDASQFSTRYSLSLPKKGSARLGFTVSTGWLTKSAAKLAKKAVAGMMPAPTITAPSPGATISGKKVVVKGTLVAGANGLPVSVKVNGHAASVTPNDAGTKATFRVVLFEPPGKHTLTAVAKDAGGNERSASITVRNK